MEVHGDSRLLTGNYRLTCKGTPVYVPKHAGVEGLARGEMFKGSGRRGLVPKPVF